MDTPLTNNLDALDELVAAQIETLSKKIGERHSLEEIQSEVAALNDLLQSYRLRDELLERLAESSTPAEQRDKIKDSLERQAERLNTQAASLHNRFRSVQETSLALQMKGKTLITEAEKAVKKAYRFISLRTHQRNDK